MADALPKNMIMLAEKVVAENAAKGVKVVTAESCTGGLVSAALTEIAGSSAVFVGGFVTYSNDAKVAMLGVNRALIEKHGAVSTQVAAAMATGAIAKSEADIAVSVSGIAGPDGGTPEKPVGTVTFGLARKGQEPKSERINFAADKSRADIRERAALYALELLLP